jgi:hypothetical protein
MLSGRNKRDIFQKIIPKMTPVAIIFEGGIKYDKKGFFIIYKGMTA